MSEAVDHNINVESGHGVTDRSCLDGRVYNLVLICTQVIAFWPLWEWYANRLFRYPENHVAILSLIAGLVILFIGQASVVPPAKFIIPIGCLLVYTVLQPFVHPMALCIIAAVSIGYTASYFVTQERRLPVVCLFLISLPVIPSLHAYIGYPLRVVIAEMAVPLARMHGILDTVREGVGLRWSDGLAIMDEPCSGVKMLWTGYFLAFTILGLYPLSVVRTLFLLVTTLGFVILGNLLRTVSLFVCTVNGYPLNDMGHSIVGLFWFGLAGLAIVAVAMRLFHAGRLVP